MVQKVIQRQKNYHDCYFCFLAILIVFHPFNEREQEYHTGSGNP